MGETKLKAKLVSIRYTSPDQMFMVGTFLQSDTYHRFVGAGKLSAPEVDFEYELIGHFGEHPRYGTQFMIEGAQKILPTQKEAIIAFLSSSRFPTIGKKSAEKIYETFGEDTLSRLSEDPSLLKQLDGFPKKKIEIIEEGLAAFAGFSKTYLELVELGLSERQIQTLEEQYDNVLDVLQDDPFTPYYEVYGFGYKSSEKVADHLNIDLRDFRRIDARIHEAIQSHTMKSGDTFIEYVPLRAMFSGLNQEDFEESLQRLIEKERLEYDRGKFYPYHLLSEEKTIARSILEHQFKVEPIDEAILEEKIEEVEFAYAIEYDPTQKKAIKEFFNHSFMILNGGPGTGKTTIVKGILALLKSLFPSAIVQLCAPTGRASKRLYQLSQNDSKTIHSLLQWNLEDNSFKKNVNDPLDIDFLIVDETSMVDTHVFSQLLLALPSHTRILLIGDEDQLESVGPGKVFNDLIDSKQFPLIHLEKIFRQSSGSGIPLLAQNIREETRCHYEDGVKFQGCRSYDVMSMITQYLQRMDRFEREKVQVIAPKYKGSAGIDAINQTLQLLLNPPAPDKKEWKIGTYLFRENDRVMLLKNMPEDDVYNGDMGVIVQIENSVISVDFGEQIVDFDQDILYYLTLAYCISVHKSQGSEYSNVICVVADQASFMMNKRLLYTAISRAKKELLLLGDQRLFEEKVRQANTSIRRTTLQEKLDPKLALD
ncbi:SF1B family DNA helicase RecD2 [Dubosiella newyorkensis]|uniref:SF1B family DNA helicase RecD2 n=1 Tax=Dubosiella newyorkensis TaxID=1862672 RepID=UPI0025858F5C|nr:ATP-dependent RecD-like DNA helicase [Dubosiella newyorkensis]